MNLKTQSPCGRRLGVSSGHINQATRSSGVELTDEATFLPFRWFMLSMLLTASTIPVFAAPQVAWTARYAFGTNSDGKVFTLNLDRGQNLLVAGSSKNDQGNMDYAVLKYSSTGSNIWTRRFDSGTTDTVRGLALDNEDNVLVTGTSLTVKYDAKGTFQWTAPYGGRAIAVDPSNHVCVTGFSETDFATAKLTPDGSNVWMRTHDWLGRTDISQALGIDSSGNVYAGGKATYYCNSRLGCRSQLFIAKYSPDGTEEWVQAASPGMMSDESEVRAVQVDVHGNAISTGNTYGGAGRTFTTYKFETYDYTRWYTWRSAVLEGVTSMALDPDGGIYLTGRAIRSYPEYIYYKTYKLDTNGAIVWQANYYGPGAGYHRANAIAVNSAKSVYITGQSPPEPWFPDDWATIKYDSSGQEQWVVRYDGPVHGEDQATAIVVDNAGAIYVGGFTTTTNGIEMLVIKYVEMETIQIQNDQAVKLQFLGTPGQNYRFQSTTNFSDWDELGFSIADLLGLYQWLDTNAPLGPYKFYRTLSP